MNKFTTLRTLSSLVLGATLVAGCGVQVRPRVPVFAATAVVTPVVISAESAPPAYNDAPPMAPASTAAPDDVGVVTQYVQSGGSSFATAEVITAGSTLLGRVSTNAPRFYAIDLQAGDAVSLHFYMRYTSPVNAYSSDLVVLEPDEVRIENLHLGIYNGDWARKLGSFVAKQSGRHYLRVSSEKPSQYKVTVNGTMPAG